ncbi:MAG: hypothetical protein PT977_11415, partial [Acidobacteriota bacterium]|nr:hypothetical protein [Acidobacteriota bacterium]
SVMPQTREHLDILKLLGVSAGVIARTKSDLTDAETGALVEDEIRALVKGSFLANASIVAVSAVTGAGLDALKAALTRAARGLVRQDRTKRVPRLFIDRAFTMKGFGPVVTGTLDGGRIAAEDTLTLFPDMQDVRVRRIEVHGDERKEAWAGERTSLNLAGVERLTLRRGQALAARGGLEPSSVLTAEIAWLPTLRSPLADGARLRVHLGTADVAGRVHALSNGFAQVTLESPLPARPGDRFVLRRPSPVETVGGGRVLDAGRPRLRRRSGGDAGHLVHVLSVLSGGDERDLADLFLLEAGPRGLTAAHLGPRLGVPAPAAAVLLDALAASGKALRIAPALYAHAGTASSLGDRAAAAFAERRKSGGVSVSFAKSEFAERLAKALSPAAVDGWIAVLLAGKKIALDGDRVVPPGAKAADLAGDSASFAAKIADGFRVALFEPPHPHELARVLGTKPAVVEGLVSHLVKSGTLVRLSPDLVVHKDVALAAEKKLEAVRGQTLSVAGFRDLLGLTRKTL